jgi:hypothetical protein
MTLGRLAGATLALLTPSADALACGGFFCSQTPVLQTAERIVFEVEGDVVTAYVQLQYTGNDPNFAWVVPVPDVPEVEVGVGQEMFTFLEDQTKPVFIDPPVTSSAAPSSAAIGPIAGCGDFGSGGGGFGGTPFAGDPGLSLRYVPVPDVDVLDNRRVGPYEVAVITAARAGDLNNWLNANGYRVQQGAEPIVQAYLDDGMKLLGLKLAPEAGSTSVEPIKMTYRDSRGCAAIPLKLTAIASTPGLEIVTWVFAESRVAPANFESASVPTSRLFEEADYLGQLSSAVDAQGGRAFVTEFAGKTDGLVSFGDPNLKALLAKHGYVTRLRTTIDPSEMTDDPEFDDDAPGGDVSREVMLASRPIKRATASVVLAALFAILLLRRRS